MHQPAGGDGKDRPTYGTWCPQSQGVDPSAKAVERLPSPPLHTPQTSSGHHSAGSRDSSDPGRTEHRGRQGGNTCRQGGRPRASLSRRGRGVHSPQRAAEATTECLRARTVRQPLAPVPAGLLQARAPPLPGRPPLGLHHQLSTSSRRLRSMPGTQLRHPCKESWQSKHLAS